MKGSQEILAGVGLGGAIGILVGMSNAPVVAIVVSSLVALLATFFGLSASSSDGTRVVRIASFGIVFPIAVLLGLTARSHRWLTPSVKRQVAEWTEAGYSPSQAQALVAFRELGVIHEGVKTSPLPPNNGGLFANDVQSQCGLFLASRFPSVTDRTDAMRKAGGDWKDLVDSLENLDNDRRSQAIEAAYRLVCR